MEKPSASQFQGIRKDSLDNNASASLALLSSQMSQLTNVLSQLITGSNYNPTRHGSIGIVSNLLSQTKFAEALGINNPTQQINAAKDITGMLYGYNNNPASQLNQIRTVQNLNNYAQYSRENQRNNVYRVDEMTQAAIAKQLVASGTLSSADMDTLGQKGSKATSAMDGASKVVKVSQKILGMGDDLEQIMGTAQAVAGTNNFEKAADTYLSFVKGMVDAGLSLAERQSAITTTMHMAKQIQSKTGVSMQQAAATARTAMSGAIVGAKEARLNGIENYDTVAAANNLAAMQLEAEQTEDGQAKLVATRTIMENDSLTKEQKQALLKQVRSGSPQQIEALMQSNGMADSYASGRRISAMDPSWARDVLDKETLEEMDITADEVGKTYTAEQMEEFFKHNVAQVGKSGPEYDSAMKVKEAMRTGDWSKVSTKDLDRSRKYLTKEGRDVAIAQRSAFANKSQKDLASIESLLQEGSQFHGSLSQESMEQALESSGVGKYLDKDAIIKTSTEEKDQIALWKKANNLSSDEEAEKQYKDFQKQMKEQKIQGDVSVRTESGLLTFDAKTQQIKSHTDEKKYKEALKKKQEADAKEDPVGAILVMIKDILEKWDNTRKDKGNG
jgi:hypothetical protein